MSLKAQELPWQPEPLPRGRHKLAPETVRASQRERLLRAMLECVAESGYEATTVPQVVAKARVSRNAFYEFFTDKTECFIATCDQAAEGLLEELVALAAEPDWIEAARRGADIYLRWWQERPGLSRAYFLGLPQAGERAVEQRERNYEPFRAMFRDLGRRARAEQPDLPQLRPIVPRILVLSIAELVAEEVRAGRVDRLTELEDDLFFWMVRMLADDATWRRIAGHSATP
jgi:AcrR family transcriptional regulator